MIASKGYITPPNSIIIDTDFMLIVFYLLVSYITLRVLIVNASNKYSISL